MRSGQNLATQLGLPSWKLSWDMAKKEIRRCFKRFRYQVKKLRRVAIGGLKLGKLPLGTYRELKEKEIDLLFPKQIS